MDIWLNVALYVLIVIVHFTDDVLMVSNPCTVESIQACIMPLDNYAHHANTIFPKYTDNELHDICRSYSMMEECLRPIKPNCVGDQYRVYYEGLELGCEFLCKNQSSDFLAHRQCLSNPSLENEGQYCNITYTKQLEEALNLPRPNKEKRDRVCRETYSLLDCVHEAVNKYCGEDAANWIENMNRKIMTVYIQECETANKVGIAVIFGTSFGLFSVLLAIIIISIVCRRQQSQASLIGLNRLGGFSTNTTTDRNTKVHLMYHDATSSTLVVDTSRGNDMSTCVPMCPNPLYDNHDETSAKENGHQEYGSAAQAVLETTDGKVGTHVESNSLKVPSHRHQV